MNRFEKILSMTREAKLNYQSGEYQVTKTGDFVRCAVTENPIPLADLRYWSVELQEAYCSAEASLKRIKELKGL